MHDIGKLGVGDGILLKPGPLTDEERKLMQLHVQIGYDLVKDIPFLADAAEIILSHHERYDGGGYPRGLQKEEILLSARFFAIADTLNATPPTDPTGVPLRLRWHARLSLAFPPASSIQEWFVCSWTFPKKIGRPSPGISGKLIGNRHFLGPVLFPVLAVFNPLVALIGEIPTFDQ